MEDFSKPIRFHDETFGEEKAQFTHSTHHERLLDDAFDKCQEVATAMALTRAGSNKGGVKTYANKIIGLYYQSPAEIEQQRAKERRGRGYPNKIIGLYVKDTEGDQASTALEELEESETSRQEEDEKGAVEEGGSGMEIDEKMEEDSSDSESQVNI